MQFALHLTPKDLPLPKAIEQRIQDKVAKLAAVYHRIQECRIVLEGPVHHHKKGGPYKARIDLSVPGAELVVNRHEAADLRVAIRDAFEAARRRLEDYVQCQRGEVKTHRVSPPEPPAEQTASANL